MEGVLTYAESDSEANQLAVDVVRIDNVDYIRFRELGGVAIEVEGTDLVNDSASQARAPLVAGGSIEIQTGELDDSVSLTLDPKLTGSLTIDTGTANTADSVTVLGTSGDDAMNLEPRRLVDGSKAIELVKGGLTAALKVNGLVTVDISQNGTDTVTVDRSITGYGHEVRLKIIGGGTGNDSMSVTAPGSIPQTMTLTDGHVVVQDSQAGSELLLGRSDNIAIDQPKVTVEVITSDAQGNEVSLGPSAFSTFLLDTGATSLLFASEATGDMMQTAEDNGTTYNTYDIPYNEQGVAGVDVWDVSKPYRVDFAGNSGVRNTLNNVQVLSSEANSFSFLGPWGIVGMPAMLNRVTNLDMTGWHDLQDLLDLSMKVDFSSGRPAATGHQYSVPLKLVEFPTDGQQEGGPIPTAAPLPFLNVKMQDNGNRASGQFLLDTGAQLSMISTQMAITLGLDKNHNGTLEDEALEHIDVGGVGGTVSIPLVAVDRASVGTDQGKDLVWTDLLVGVLDIEVTDGPQIAGVFGSDYLTSGWAAHVLPPLLGEPGSELDGYFQHVSFDFLDADNDNGSMILDVTPERDVATAPNASTLDITYTNLSSVSATGGSADDTFLVTPSTTIAYVIDGGDEVTADSLRLAADGLNVVDDGSTARIDGYKDIKYTDIEDKNFGDTEPAGATITPAGGLVTTEAGGAASFTVVLNRRPTANVTIPLSSSDTTEGTVSPASLVFTPDNWATAQTVAVTGVDDGAVDGNVAYNIVVGPSTSSDSAYDGLNPADVTAVNIDNDTLQIASIQATPTGFVATFNQPIDVSTLNLFDTASGLLGPADLSLVGDSTGAVRGTLVPSADGLSVTLLRSAGVLAADSYKLTLRSASNGFRSASGETLDGDADGVPGGDFSGTFTIASQAAGTVVVSVPDFGRGQTQTVNVPANATGLPIRLSDGNGVTSVTLDLKYNPSLLTITGITALPTGSSATLDTSTPGLARITFSSPALTSGALDIVRLTASIPSDAPYTAKEVIDLSNIVVQAGSSTLPSLADDGLHVAAYLGDMNGDGKIISGDVTLLRRVVVGVDPGFAAAQLADPRSAAVGDINANGSVDSADITQLRRFITGQSTNFIPTKGPDVASTPGPDPLLYVSSGLSGLPGQVVTVPVKLSVSEQDGVDVSGFDLALQFDPRKFIVSGVRLGDLVDSGADRFDTPFARIDNQAGTIQLTTSSQSGMGVHLAHGTDGDIILIDLTIRANAAAGPTSLNLLAGLGNTVVNVSDDLGRPLRLVPAPSNSANEWGVDGSFTVLSATKPVRPPFGSPTSRDGIDPGFGQVAGVHPPKIVSASEATPDPLSSGAGRFRQAANRHRLASQNETAARWAARQAMAAESKGAEFPKHETLAQRASSRARSRR